MLVISLPVMLLAVKWKKNQILSSKLSKSKQKTFNRSADILEDRCVWAEASHIFFFFFRQVTV